MAVSTGVVEAEYDAFRDQLVVDYAAGGDRVRAPAQWSIGVEVSCYDQFGYGNYFHLLAGYPDKMRKLIEIKAVPGEAGALQPPNCIPRVKL